MEQESFEDEEIAAYLNEHFVAIKVDREERPDVDHIYMTVCQRMTGQGGWPLTIVMTAEKKPFFAGTYFPKVQRYGHPGLQDLLPRLIAAWEGERERIDGIGRQIELDLCQHDLPEAEGVPDRRVFADALESYRESFDPVYGGFAGAPKFPSAHQLLFLLRHYAITGEDAALNMAQVTLRAMYAGGLWDHVGFGFARYSTDEKWLIPHFEKMLYDNAMLAHAYLDAFAQTGDAFAATVARQIFAYVLRDMTSANGAFYSAEDADSEGEEGKFYTFTRQEIDEILDPDEAEEFCRRLGVSQQGNFEHTNVLNRLQTSREVPDAATGERSERARQKVFAAREQRVHPHKDDKVLTAWNALMIAALAKGGRVLQDPSLCAAAVRADEAIAQLLTRQDGRLLARYRNGEAKYLAYLDDYAFLAWAQLELYEALLDPKYLQRALDLVRDMRRLFFDEARGGFHFYGVDGEQLPARPKEVYDGAMPSGNSAATYVLAKLSILTGDDECVLLRDRQVEACYGLVQRHPQGHAFFLMALQLILYPVKEIVLSVERADDAGLESLLQEVRKRFLPQSALLLRTDDDATALARLAPFTAAQQPVDGKAHAYVCESFFCNAPVTDAGELAALLDRR